MLEKLVFNLLACSLFIIIFFKIIRKDDANYIGLLVLQAIGITISFVEIRLGIDISNFTVATIRYILSILIPFAIVVMEIKGLNFSEILSVIAAKFFMMIGDTKTAKTILVKLVSKYPESYYGHKYLAECYEKEGGMRKAIDEYVKVLDIRGDDYKTYFKISKLLNDLGKKNEAIEMLNILVKQKPELYEANKMLRRFINRK